MREPGPPGWGSLRWDSKVWLRVLRDSDHWVITLQIADPSSHQRGRPTDTRPQISDSNIPTGSNIWLQVPQGCSISRRTYWLTVSSKVTSPHHYVYYSVFKKYDRPDLLSRGHPTETRQQLSDDNIRTESNIWPQIPKWARHLDILAGWLVSQL
jgi:hypothetical protein